MLGITRILREAHARGECRWGCPVCKKEEDAKAEQVQEPAEEQKSATDYHRFDLLWAGLVRRTD